VADHEVIDREATALKNQSHAVGRALADLDVESAANFRRMEGELALLRQLGRAVESVHGIVATLANTADSTGLLAMNASIEAAHAGHQGRGFAVIAQRMRLQAETSRADAERIGETLTAMVELIGQASRAADETAQGAQATHVRIEDTKILVEGLTASGDNLEAFSRRNRQAVESLKQAGRGVASASGAVAAGTSQIAESTRSLRQVSDAVVREAGTILEGTDHVASVVEDIREVANRLTTVSRSLEENLQRIKTG
jgi:methyl-accepting chemotaxis protein